MTNRYSVKVAIVVEVEVFAEDENEAAAEAERYTAWQFSGTYPEYHTSILDNEVIADPELIEEDIYGEGEEG